MNTSANTKRSLTIGISDPPKKEARISGLSFIVSDGHAFTGSRTPSDFVGLRFAHGNYHIFFPPFFIRTSFTQSCVHIVD